MFYYVYVLQSLKDKNFYIGFTTNLKNRLNDHNSEGEWVYLAIVLGGTKDDGRILACLPRRSILRGPPLEGCGQKFYFVEFE